MLFAAALYLKPFHSHYVAMTVEAQPQRRHSPFLLFLLLLLLLFRQLLPDAARGVSTMQRANFFCQ